MTVGNWRLNSGIARSAICLCFVFSLTACASQTVSQTEPMPPQAAPEPPLVAIPEPRAKPSKTVKTSYQGSDTAGQPTASGEPYNPNDLTAASRTLPIGSTVKVTNPETGRSVKVRINDRGPFVRGRSLDLSKRAAEKIGIADKGVARVKVTPVADGPESPSPIATPASPADTLRSPDSS
jgi:rare lipoprotein A